MARSVINHRCITGAFDAIVHVDGREFTLSVRTCGVCKALVPDGSFSGHWDWHNRQEVRG